MHRFEQSNGEAGAGGVWGRCLCPQNSATKNHECKWKTSWKRAKVAARGGWGGTLLITGRATSFSE